MRMVSVGFGSLRRKSRCTATLVLSALATLGAPGVVMAAGDLDPTFGAGGGVTTAISGGYDGIANALVLQPDGKLVAAGVAGPSFERTTPDHFALVRYNTD